jgi:hypothetical protein
MDDTYFFEFHDLMTNTNVLFFEMNSPPLLSRWGEGWGEGNCMTVTGFNAFALVISIINSFQ